MPMTEAEWAKCTQPRRMLDHIRETASTRKKLLFSCASCRRVWDCITDARSRHAIETAERHADDLASVGELRRATSCAERACIAGDSPTARAFRAAYAVADSPWAVNHQLLIPGNRLGNRRRQASLLNDIFGNPFRPPAPLSPAVLAWNDGIVPRLAQAIYDERQLPAGT